MKTFNFSVDSLALYFLFQFNSRLLFERLLMRGDFQHPAIRRSVFNKYFKAKIQFFCKKFSSLTVSFSPHEFQS